MSKGSILIKNGILVTMNSQKEIFQGNLFLEDGIIKEVGSQRTTADKILDAQGKIVMPGFIQTHIHMCQVLYRGLADDVDVVDWLKQRIWPYESAHDDESIHASAKLGIAEMISGGTTCTLSMETTLHTDAVFAAVEETGFRSINGNAMMDVVEPGTEMRGLSSEDSFLETKRLYETWHGKDNNRIQFAVMPRGARNCSPELVERSRIFAKDHGLLMHTHVSENGPLSARLKKETGLTDMELLEKQGWADSNLVIAHGVWLSDHDIEIIKNRGVKIAHCPSANMKLASGFCKVPELTDQGVVISLGGDGAPCNNNLDMFTEMRLASMIHKPRCGPTALPAYKILEMATIDGARSLGMEKEIGSLEVGKKADVIILNREELYCSPSRATPIPSQIVYSMKSNDVETTIIDGVVLYENKKFTRTTKEKVLHDAEVQVEKALSRIPFGRELLELKY